MRLIVGLGNHGLKYAQTRHNVGWLVLDEVAKRGGVTWRVAGNSVEAELRLGAEKVILIKPQTYMNASGNALLPYLSFYKLEADSIFVVQDDLDSPFGLLRIRAQGRHGGQNGVRDIIRVLGHDRFARLKIGISRPPPEYDVSNWVLSKWQDWEIPTLLKLIDIGASACATWANAGLLKTQQMYNSTDLRPSQPIAQQENTDTV